MTKFVELETKIIYDCENCGCRFSEKKTVKKISFILEAN